jgi:hypothetical protein
MSLMAILGIYVAGFLATVALFRLRPPQWFLKGALDAEHDLRQERPGHDHETYTMVLASTTRVMTIVAGAMWPLMAAALILDAPAIVIRKCRNKHR